MTDEEALEILHQQVNSIARDMHYEAEKPEVTPTYKVLLDRELAICRGIHAIEERVKRRNPQPLTLDELRKMEGKPVWFEDGDEDRWCLVGVVVAKYEIYFCFAEGEIWKSVSECGKTWFAYRSKPETDDTRTKPGYGTGKTLGFINQMMEANT